MAKPLLLPATVAAAAAARLPSRLAVGAAPPFRVLPFFLCPPPQSRSLSFSPVSAVSTAGKRGRSPPPPPSPVISEGRDDEDAAVGRPVCPGCGVFMQDADPNLPGFFKNPSRLSDDEKGEDGSPPLAAEPDGFLGDDEEDGAPSESDLAAELDGLDSDLDESSAA